MSTIELGYTPTVPDLLGRAVYLFGDREYVVTDEGRATFAEVDVAARHLALKLVAAGVGKCTRVGARFSYGREWIVAWLAINRIGAIYLPFSTAYKPAELRQAVRHGDVHLLLVPSTLFWPGPARLPRGDLSASAVTVDTAVEPDGRPIGQVWEPSSTSACRDPARHQVPAVDRNRSSVA